MAKQKGVDFYSLKPVFDHARKPYGLDKSLPISEKELRERESTLGYSLPTVLRNLYQEYGTTSPQYILRMDRQFKIQPLKRTRYKEQEEYLSEDMHFFEGDYYFKPSQGDDPPVYFFQKIVGVRRDGPYLSPIIDGIRHIQIARRLSEYINVLTDTYHSIVIKGKVEVLREHFILAGLARESDFEGWSEAELSEFEMKNNIKLPGVFRRYLGLFAKTFPSMNNIYYIFPLNGLKKWSKADNEARVPQKAREQYKKIIPDDAFFFWFDVWNDENNFLIRLGEDENPPLYFAFLCSDVACDLYRPSLTTYLYEEYLSVIGPEGGRYLKGGSIRNDSWQLYQKLCMDFENAVGRQQYPMPIVEGLFPHKKNE